MKKPLREMALEYLMYMKEQGITHVPASRVSPPLPAKTPPKPRTAPQPAPPPVGPPRPPTAPDSSQPPPPQTFPILSSGNPQLDAISAEIASCQACPLGATRTRTVPGQGATQPDILFVGEGPGADEDQQGLAFVGRAGQLLTKMILAMGYSREQVFIGNIVKCRPPGNRVPAPEEMACCLPFLKRQIAILRPKRIVCLGATAARGLVQERLPIGKARGQWREFEGIPVMLTFHPAYLLRDPRKKSDAWADLKAVLAHLGKPLPKTSA